LRDVERWRLAERQFLPEVVVAAVATGDPVLKVAGPVARGFPAPLLFVQHDADALRDAHMDERMVDRLRSPFTAEEFLGRIDALVRLRRVILRGEVGRAPVETSDPAEVSSKGGMLRALGNRLAALLGTRLPRYAKPPMPYLEVVGRVADWADRRDIFEPGHAERVTAFAAMMADGLGIPDGEASVLLRAAMLHDIGKVAVPVEVLRHDGPLADDQMRLIRTHPERGANLLSALHPDDEVAEAILYHHERVDGTGYYGKPGNEIPTTARILAVAETFDAMTTAHVGETLSSDRALGTLKERRGSHFDGDCVDTLVEAFRPRPTYVRLSD
jgi:putative nucleotidyltransferase with HDIG domain